MLKLFFYKRNNVDNNYTPQTNITIAYIISTSTNINDVIIIIIFLSDILFERKISLESS